MRVVKTWYRLVIVVCKVISKLVSIRNSGLYGDTYGPLISVDNTSEVKG